VEREEELAEWPRAASPFGESVVHFEEWTTGWGRNCRKVRKRDGKSWASGPLWRVDHWLRQKLRKRPQIGWKAMSQWTTLESGPLAEVETVENGAKGVGS